MAKQKFKITNWSNYNAALKQRGSLTVWLDESAVAAWTEKTTPEGRESFVKTMKRDYISMTPKPNQQVALKNLAIAFEHYNEKHPHSALEYRSPREYRRQRESLT